MTLTNAERCKNKRANNPDKYREYSKKCYIKNNGKEKTYARVIRFRAYQNECKRMWNILLG